MKLQLSLAAALASAPAALAHTVFVGLMVDGVYQGPGLGMRMSRVAAKAGSPLNDLASTDMACNVNGTTGVSRVMSVKDGSTLSFPFQSYPDDPSRESLDVGHKGPCAMYLKKVDSAITDTAYGNGWFKLWDDGYDGASGQWCTDKVIANGGRISVKLPPGLAGGYYLARPEIVALHNASNGNPQFYTGCAQVFIESSGNLVPQSTVSIPGHVHSTDGDMTWNIYTADNSRYAAPGPPVAALVAGATASGNQVQQKDGLQPAGCIATNDNWCGYEVPAYSDEAGCWASQQKCWDQDSLCYNVSLPTGSSGCKTWESKCKDLENACKAGNFNGPPNAGKSLIAPLSTVSVGALLPTSGVSLGAASATQNSAASSTAPASSASTSAAASSAPSYPASSSVSAQAVSAPTSSSTAQPSTLATQASSSSSCSSTTTAAPTAAAAAVTVTHTAQTTQVAYATTIMAKARRAAHVRRHPELGLLGVF